MTEPNRYEIIMGGLTHDVGKFYQRATRSEKVLSSYTRGLESTICPLDNARYTHRHVLFTSEFCSTYLDNLPDGLNAHSIHALASYHHFPSDSFQRMITEADWLSSGTERIKDEAEAARAKGQFRKVRLRAIMAEIVAGAGRDVRWEHRLVPLRASECFPEQRNHGPSEDLTDHYALLWDAFIESWQKNKVRDPWGFVNRCLGILEQYTWCIPSATWGTVPDVSLYDHMKTTAAIAGCLSVARENSKPFLLVACDFAGIQKYICDIHPGAGGLAKRLRSRSFFVDLANCSVAYEILRRVDLPLTNCLMLSGGKFILLLPNTSEVLRELEQVRVSLDIWSVNETGGEVRLNMAVLPCSGKELKDYPTALSSLHARLNDEKLRPLRSYLLREGPKWDQEAFVLGPILDATVGEGLCIVCQKKGGLPNANGETVCTSCSWDAGMGGALPGTGVVAFYDRKQATEGWRLPFGSVHFARSPDAVEGSPFLVMGLDGFYHDRTNLPLVPGYRARHVPIDVHGNVLEFEQLGDQATGRKAIACLKADVDNLGWVFQFGLLEDAIDRRSISRLSTLSGAFNLFFSAYFEHLLRTEFRWTYTVYSGGDDLLCVGPWDEIFRLAGRVRSDFRKFCCGNPSLTMSAGIVLPSAKTPVNMLADETDRLLKVSKEIGGPLVLPDDDAGDGSPAKDRITAFETSFPWYLFPHALERAEYLSRLLAKEEVGASQVRRMLQYSELFRKYQRTGKTSYFRYAPMMVHDLKRNWQKQDRSEDYEDLLDWVSGLAAPDNPEMAVLRFIAQYALYGIRGVPGGGNGEGTKR